MGKITDSKIVLPSLMDGWHDTIQEKRGFLLMGCVGCVALGFMLATIFWIIVYVAIR